MSGYNGPTDENEDQRSWSDYYNLYYTKRGKIQLNISQQLGRFGSLYVTGSQQSYWHTGEKNTLLQVGYSDTWRACHGASLITKAVPRERTRATSLLP